VHNYVIHYDRLLRWFELPHMMFLMIVSDSTMLIEYVH